MARTKDPDPLTRRRILEAALDLFAKNGFDATGVAEIVEHAHVTKGALYHYFSAKEEILFELYRSIFQSRQEFLNETIAAELTATETLRRAIVDLVTQTGQTARESAVFTRGARSDSPLWHDMQQRWRTYQDDVRGIIARGQEAGEFTQIASPHLVSWSIFGFTNSMHTWFDPGGEKPASEVGTQLADFILAGLRA